MYLTSNAVIHCSHGGRLVPDRRSFTRLGKQKLLTRDSVLQGKIKDCPSNCHKVIKLIKGYESEASNSPLLMNLEFLTDSNPPGRAVILGEPTLKKDSRARAILLTSITWFCLGLAAVLVTIFYYQRQFDSYQTNIRNECEGQMKTIRDDLTKVSN